MSETITNGKLNIPEGKWYIIYVIETKELRNDIQLADEDIGGRIGSELMCVVFDTEEEGLLYIEENLLLTEEDIINSTIEEDEAEEE